MRVCGIDPGAHCGVSIFDTDKKQWYADQMMLREVSKGKYRFDGSEMEEWLLNLEDVDVFVVEDFIQRPRKMAGKGNEVWIEQYTAKTIGAIAMKARIIGAKYVEQQPLILTAAYAWMKLEYPKDKNHIRDAMAHAYFYARKIGLVTRGSSDSK